MSENSKLYNLDIPIPEKALDQAISDRIPANPRKATQWAVSVFRAWCDARGIKDAPEKLSIDMLADLLAT